MASARVNFSVGLFMTAGLALATLAVIWLGMSSFLRRGQIFVTYFDESVQGLGVDSPVKYRGVPVGRVKSIGIAPDFHLIEVTIMIEDKETTDATRFENGVAFLSNVGITGAMFVEIDKLDPQSKDFSPALSFTPEHPVIASRRSVIRKFFREVDEITAKIQSVDFKGISDEAMAAVTTLHTTIAETELGEISRDIRQLLANINEALGPKQLQAMAQNMDQSIRASRQLMEGATSQLTTIDEILKEFQTMLATNRPHVDTAMISLANTMTKTEGFVAQGEATMLQMQWSIKNLQERLTMTAENLEQTSASLNSLISNVENQPSQLIFSKPPKPRIVEE